MNRLSICENISGKFRALGADTRRRRDMSLWLYGESATRAFETRRGNAIDQNQAAESDIELPSG